MGNIVKAGFSSVALVRATGVGAPDSTGWLPIDLARDVSLNIESAEIDVSSRGGAGWVERIPGLRDLTVDLEMLDVTNDAAYLLLRASYISRIMVGLHVLNGPLVDPNDDDVQGPRFNAWIMNFSRNEPLNDVVTWSVRFAAARGAPPTWTQYVPP